MLSDAEKRHRLRIIYHNIKQRTKNKNNKDYKRYGKQNIKMSDDWDADFENFYNDMVDTYFEDATLDRKNVYGDYSFSNTRWITRSENSAKMQRDKLLTSRNKTGYRGVSYYKNKNLYRATYKHKGKTVHLGYYKDSKEAAKAYNAFLDTVDKKHEFKRNEI